MKKNNKAFTIVELLAVMMLLLIVSLVAYPNFSKLTTEAKSKYDNSIKVLAKSGARMYVNNNKDEIDEYFSSNPNGKLCIPLGKLAAYDYFDASIKTSNGEEVNLKQCVNVTKKVVNSNTKYEYELSSTDVISSSKDYLPPILILRRKDGIPITVECGKVINASDFDKCEVIVSDNVDSNIQIDRKILNENNQGSYTSYEYNATDSSGNKAIPIRIKVLNE